MPSIKNYFSHPSIYESKLLSIGQKLNQALDRLETIPIIFSQNTETTEKQRHTMHEYIHAAKSLKKVLSSHPSIKIQNLRHHLEQRLTGLRYRIEAQNGGSELVAIDQHLLKQLVEMAGRWKLGQHLNPIKTVSARDFNKIEETCRYPKFVQLLLKDTSLQNSFFNWILRDNNGVRPFVEFPSTCFQIQQSALASRIGRFGENTLSIKKKHIRGNPETCEKILTLPFFNGLKTKHISVLDENKIVSLNGNYRLTVKEIFNVFKNKMNEPGPLEFFGVHGITNWHIHEHGWWDANKSIYHKIDLSLEEWWKQLPPYEILDKEQLKTRYGVFPNPNEWIVAAMGSRVVPNLNLEESHGYLEIAMPLDNGEYQIFDFGKFAAIYPLTVWQQLSFLTSTVIGRIAYPDENPFYSHRQHAKFPLVLNEQEGKCLMDHIRQELIKADSNNVIFQFSGENCAFWVQSLLQTLVPERVPNLFKIYLLDVHPSHPALGKIFRVFRRAPKAFQRTIIRVFDRCLGSHRKLAITENGKSLFKSLMTTPSRNEQAIFAPGLLHKQIEEGKLPGLIAFGH